MFKALAKATSAFLDFIDTRHIIRRAMVLTVLWQLIDVYVFAKHLVEVSHMSGTELAAVIAALTVPVTALQGVLFKLYGEGRKPSDDA